MTEIKNPKQRGKKGSYKKTQRLQGFGHLNLDIVKEILNPNL